MTNFGLMINPRDHGDRKEIVTLAERADELGYTCLWIPESWDRDAFSILTEAAIHTKRIELGTSIATVWARTPANTAQAIASLDEVSGGRARLGLGITGPVVVEDFHGVKWEKPFRRTREYVEIVRLAVAGERLNYDGDIFHLRHFKLAFSPPRPRIPIYIGAFGPKSIFAAGSLADGWLAVEQTPYYFREMLGEMTKGAESVGRKRSDLKASYHAASVLIVDSEADIPHLRELARRRLAFRVAGLGSFHADLWIRQGFAEEVEACRRMWQAGDRAAATAQISEDMLEWQALIGSVEDVRRKLKEFCGQGADEVCITFPPDVSIDMLLNTLEALA